MFHSVSWCFYHRNHRNHSAACPRWPCRSSPGPRPPRPRSVAAWSPRGRSLCTSMCTSKHAAARPRSRDPKHKTCHFPKGPTDSYRFLQILQVLIRFEFEILEKCETIDFVMNSNMNLFVFFAEQPGLICTRLGPFTAALPRLCTDQEHAAATAKPKWAVKVDRSPR